MEVPSGVRLSQDGLTPHRNATKSRPTLDFASFLAAPSIDPFEFDLDEISKSVNKRAEEEKAKRKDENSFIPPLIELFLLVELIHAWNMGVSRRWCLWELVCIFKYRYCSFRELDNPSWNIISSEMINMPLCCVPKNIKEMATNWMGKLELSGCYGGTNEEGFDDFVWWELQHSLVALGMEQGAPTGLFRWGQELISGFKEEATLVVLSLV
ncbi:hypothetical protein AMTR_s00058p00217820 [Amborella trichopoda]|uniref:Uncharacterized protein n=1 Tax=Amborella trichopoda TaxID=13333 RepID=W1PGA3_AMBTC|nr:hypothetical protein AMTR_s00058p00217820 [Amborella trichopoda]